MSSTDLTNEANAGISESTYEAIQAQIEVIEGLRQQVTDLTEKHDSVIQNFNRNRRSRRHSGYNHPPPVPRLRTIPGSPTEPSVPGLPSARLQTPKVPLPPLRPPPTVHPTTKRGESFPSPVSAYNHQVVWGKEDPFNPVLVKMVKEVTTAFVQQYTSKKITLFKDTPSVYISPSRQKRMDRIRKLCHIQTREERDKLPPRSCGLCTACKANRADRLAKRKARAKALRQRRLRAKQAKGLELTINELLELTAIANPSDWLRLGRIESKEAPEKMSVGGSRKEARRLRCIIEGAPPIPPPSPIDGKLAKGPFCCQLGPIIPVIMPAVKTRARSASPDLDKYTTEKEAKSPLTSAVSQQTGNGKSPQSEKPDFELTIEEYIRRRLSRNGFKGFKKFKEERRGSSDPEPKPIHPTPEKAKAESSLGHSSAATYMNNDDGNTVNNPPKRAVNHPPLPLLPKSPVASLKKITDSSILQRRAAQSSRVSEGKVSKLKQKADLDDNQNSSASIPKRPSKDPFERVLKELEEAAYAYALIENEENLTNIRNARASKPAGGQDQSSGLSDIKFRTSPLEYSTDFTFAIACKCVGMLRSACEELKLAMLERKSKQDRVDAFVSDQRQLKIVRDMAVELDRPTLSGDALSKKRKGKEKTQSRRVTNEQFLATAVVPFLELGYKLDVVKVYGSSAPVRTALVRQFYTRHDDWITGRGLEGERSDTDSLDSGVDLLKRAYSTGQRNPLDALNDAIIAMEKFNWITDQGRGVEPGSNLDLLRIAIRQQQKDRYEALNEAVEAMNRVEDQENKIRGVIASMRLRLRYVLSVYSTNTLIKSLPEPTKAELLKEEKRILSLGSAPEQGMASPSSSEATTSSDTQPNGGALLHAAFNIWSGDGLINTAGNDSKESTDIRERWWYRQALAQRRLDREVWQKLANSAQAKENHIKLTAKSLATPAPSKGKRGKKKKPLDLPLCAKIIEVNEEDSLGQTDLEGVDLSDPEEVMRRLLSL